nr:RNA-directed DNA polymerase, eukaryota, reverse transcriptase zinc-binding domain protein [Tanacetum cinerariifolium]
MPPKRNGMSAAVIEPLISQRVADALSDYEANQNSGNGNDNRNGSHDLGSGSRRTLHITHGCTYKEFLNLHHLARYKWQNVSRAYTVWPSEKREYAGTLPLCNKCKYHYTGPCTAKCKNYKRIGHQRHYRSECLKLKNQNRKNQAGSSEACGRVYALGGGEVDQCYKKEANKAASSVDSKYNAKEQTEERLTHVSKEVNDGFAEVRNRKNVRIDNKKVVKEKTLVKTPEKNTKKNASNDSGKDEGKSESNKKMKGCGKKKVNEEEEDVLKEMNGIDKIIKGNDVKGLSSSKKQKEVVNFIREEKLHVCVVLETHLKNKRIVLNSPTRLFSFQFSSMDGLNAMLKNGPWFIRNNPLILKKWNPDVNLLKEDVRNVLVWVKLHGVLVTAFSEDGLSSIAMRIGTPLMLDSYTSYMYLQSWGMSSYARAIIELQADEELKNTIMVAMPQIMGEGYYTCTVRVEYEWKPPRCSCCKVFGHTQEECPKNIKVGVAKNLKKPSETSRDSSINTTIIDKIRKYENLIIDGQAILMDEDGNPLKRKGWLWHSKFVGTCSDSYRNGDYDDDPYDDDMYEGQDLLEELQTICDNMDIRVCGRGRDLRQGDPMSPYLFTLVMEILSLLIKRKVEQNANFQYHFGCKRLKITNVCFAGDLLMFCHADKIYVIILKDAIDEFGRVVDLIPNYNKITIIFDCLNEEDKQDMLEVMPFKVEKLPIRYLDVPLASKRIRIKECKSLIDKVESRVLN